MTSPSPAVRLPAAPDSAAPARALAVLFGTLFYCMYPPVDLDLLAFVALVPLLLLIEREERIRPLLRRSFFAGWVAFALGFIWLRHVTWVGVALLAGVCAVYVALFALLQRTVAPRPSLAGFFFCMTAWAGTEYLRGTLFGGIPWFLLGHTQYKVIPVMQIVDITGVFGLSFLVAGVNYLAYWLLSAALAGGLGKATGSRGFQRACLVQAVLSAAVVGYGLVVVPPPQPPDGPRIALVQANIPQDLKIQFTPESIQEIYEKHRDLTYAIQEPYDMVAWPETMFPYTLGVFPENADALRRLAGEFGKDFLVGVLTTIPRPEEPDKFRTYNSAYLFRADGAATGRYDKMHLVPIGETVPGMHRIPLIAKLVVWLSALGAAPDLIPGDRMSIFKVGPHPFGVLICFDVIFPNLYREWSQRGATFLVTLSNDGWFRDGAELEQTLIMSQFGCASCKMGMARAMNTGISSFIDPYGRAEVLIGEGNKQKEVEGTLVRGVHLAHSTTIYMQIGDLFAQICAALAVGGALWAAAAARRNLLSKAILH